MAVKKGLMFTSRILLVLMLMVLASVSLFTPIHADDDDPDPSADGADLHLDMDVSVLHDSASNVAGTAGLQDYFGYLDLAIDPANAATWDQVHIEVWVKFGANATASAIDVSLDYNGADPPIQILAVTNNGTSGFNLDQNDIGTQGEINLAFGVGGGNPPIPNVTFPDTTVKLVDINCFVKDTQTANFTFSTIQGGRDTIIASGGGDIAEDLYGGTLSVYATTYDVAVTGPAQLGVATDFVVTAKQGAATVTDYTGTLVASSDTDAQVTFDLNGDGTFDDNTYTFTGAGNDDGTHTFTNGVKFLTLGQQTVKGTDQAAAGITGTSAAITVNPGVPAYLKVTGDAATNAGATNQLTVTAYDAWDNVAPTYTGDKAITFSGPTAIGANTPTITDKDGTAIDVGTATTLTFAAGASTVGGLLTVYKAETIDVDADDQTIDSTGDAAYDLALTVTSAGAAVNLRVTDAAGGTMNAGATNQLTVTAYDALGNVAAAYAGDKNITFTGPGVSDGANTPTVNDKDGTAVDIGSATTITFAAGVSTVGGLLTAYKAEIVDVEADDQTIDSTGDAAYDLGLTVNPEAANYLKVTGTGAMNAGATNQLTVTAYDTYGNIATAYVGDKAITFSGPAPTITNTPTVTDKDGTVVDVGTATTITFTAGASSAGGLLTAYKAETIDVDADDQTIDSTGDLAYDLGLTVTSAGAATVLVITGGAAMNAGTTNQLTITATDAYGNVAAAYTGDKVLTFSGPAVLGANTPTVTDKDGTAVDIGSATTITFAAGVSTVGGLLTAYKVETVDVDVTDQTIDSTGSTDYDLGLTVSAGTANYLTVEGTAAMNAGTTNQLTVTAYDAYGQVATGYTGDKAITFSGPAVLGANTPTVTDKDGTAVDIGSATTITFAAGVSTVGGLLTAYKVETVDVDADDQTIDSTGDAAYDLGLTVSAGTANYLTVEGTATMNAGTANQLTVTAYDVYGQVATGYTGDKAITFSGPAVSAGGNAPTVTDKDTAAIAVGTPTTITFTAGVSSAGGSLLAYKAETTTVDADDQTIDSTGDAAYDLDLVVSSSPTVALLLVTDAAGGTMNAGATNQLTITAGDAYGNTVTTYTGDQSIIFSGPAVSTSSDTPTVTDKDGTAVDVGTATTITFTNGVSTAGGLLTAYKAEATTVDAADSVNGYTSTADPAHDLDLTVNPIAAATLTVTGVPTSAEAGAAFTSVVTALDQYGNTATGYTGIVTFTTTDTSVTLTLPTNYTFVGGDNGVHTFTNGIILETVGAQTVTATDTITGTITGTSDAITITPATASKLKVTGITGPIQAGTATDVIVTAQDYLNNTDVNFVGTVTFTSSDIIAVLPTSYTFTAGDAGVHTFTNGVTFKTIGNQTVTASSGVLTDGVHVAVLVTPGDATTLTVTGITDPIEKGVASNVTVTAKDAYGNTATGYTGTVAFTSSDTSATMPGDATFAGGDNGVKTVAGLTMQTYGEQTVTATDTVNATITGTQTAITVIPVITSYRDLGADWNLFSVPYSLETGYRTWSQVLAMSEADLADNISVAYYYSNGAWNEVTSTYSLTPCDAIAIKLIDGGEAKRINLAANTSITIGGSKSLSQGWNLAGLNYYRYTGIQPAEIIADMAASVKPVEDALLSAYTGTAGAVNWGYSQVLSPPGFNNAATWTHLRDGASFNMLALEGYFVYMVNAGTLGGLTPTPLSP